MIYCKGKFIDTIFCSGKQLWTVFHKGRSDWGSGSSYNIGSDSYDVHKANTENFLYADFWNVRLNPGDDEGIIVTYGAGPTFIMFLRPPSSNVIPPAFWENRTTDGTLVGGAPEADTTYVAPNNIFLGHGDSWGRTIFNGQTAHLTAGGKGHWTLYKEYGALS